MDDTIQMKLRVPRAIRDEIEAAALLNRRSINAEIVFRLEAYERPAAEHRAVIRRLHDEQDNVIVNALLANLP